MDSDDSTFCLSPHFFSLTGKSSAAGFPTHFPPNFIPSPVHSSVTTGDNADDEEQFLAAFKHRLTQSHKLASLHAKTAMVGSPQSTLSGFDCWSGLSSVSSDSSPNGPSQAPSPPATPYGGDNNTSDLIHAAAEQVARLKMNTGSNWAIGSTLKSSNPVSSIENTGFYFHPSQIHGRGGDFHRQHGRFVTPTEELPQYTWPSLQPHHRRNPSQPCAPVVPAAIHVGQATLKKVCTGTGVFLPRRYDDNSLQSHKRTDCGSIALFPVKNIHDLNRSVLQRIHGHVPSSNEALMAQRNAIISQQSRTYAWPAERGKSHEFLLPQEWTY